ncbi:MAG: DNA polymerase [Dehalococcoidia bacterium]|nr:DNA polymerase [Dehalococcoidia bacterium]
MAFDPRKLGARCDECVLLKKRAGGPVLSEINPGAYVAAVGDAPDDRAVEENRPFCGPSGNEATHAFEGAGLKRGQVSWINVLSCQPHKNDLERVLHALQKENKKRDSDNKKFPPEERLPIMPTPQECCKGRLLNELRPYRDVVTMGKTAYQTITGGNSSIMNVRGGPVEGYIGDDGTFWAGKVEKPIAGVRQIRILPTVSPGFVMRARRWTKVFRGDLSKALRWFTGTLEWRDPAVCINPSPSALKEFLDRPHAFLVVDVETAPNVPDEDFDPLIDILRCVGFGNTEEAVVVGLLSIDGKTHIYTSEEEEELYTIIRDYLADVTKLKVGHNFRYYDTIVLERLYDVKINPSLDTIMIHSVIEAEMPHRLAFVASQYTDVVSWKDANTAVSAKTDHELWIYNAMDCVVNARCVTPMLKTIELRGQRDVLIMKHKVQNICVGLHRNGMWVNEEKRRWWDVELRARALTYRKKIIDAVGDPAFNPNSTQQVAKQLFDVWNLAPIEFTDLGDPSTGDDTIRALMLQPGLTPQQAAMLDSMRWFRRWAKYRGTFVRKLVSNTQIIYKDDLSFDDEASLDGIEGYNKNRAKGDKKRQLQELRWGMVLADGRLHPDYSAHGTVGWRLASSHPNAQNFPLLLRDMLAPHPGNIYVYADMDQLELRAASSLAGAKHYLQVFAAGGDPHAITAEGIFGAAFRDGSKEDKESLRTFSKCIVSGTRLAIPGRGLVRIEALSPGETAPGRDVAPLGGTVSVVGADGRSRQATRYYFGGMQPVLKLQTESGRELRGTGKHQLMLVSDKWRRLDKIRVGDKLLLGQLPEGIFGTYQTVKINPWVVKLGPNVKTRVKEHTASGLPSITLTENWGWVLGAIHGDGCIADHWVSIACLPEDGIIDRASEVFTDLGFWPTTRMAKRTGTKKRPRRHLKHVQVSSVAFVDFLARIGMATPKHDRKKRPPGVKKYEQRPRKVMRVPDVIFKSPKTVVANYLAGLFDTDGTVADGGWSFTTKAEAYAQDVQLLLEMFGIRSSIKANWNSEYERYYYTLWINRFNSYRFRDEITQYMVCRRKFFAFTVLSAGWGDGWADDEFEVVKSIEQDGEAGVHDLVVPDGYAFVANGLINHNTFVYAVIYGAEAETIQQTIAATEDKQGRLVYKDITLRETRNRVDNWLKANPEFKQWWDDEIALYRKNGGHLAEVVIGLRRDFLDGEDKNEINNYRCQSSGSALVHLATLDFLKSVPFEKWGPGTGIVQQGHDALVVEVPIKEAEWVAKELTACMTRMTPGFPGVTFTAKAKLYSNWRDPLKAP